MYWTAAHNHRRNNFFFPPPLPVWWGWGGGGACLGRAADRILTSSWLTRGCRSLWPDSMLRAAVLATETAVEVSHLGGVVMELASGRRGIKEGVTGNAKHNVPLVLLAHNGNPQDWSR